MKRLFEPIEENIYCKIKNHQQYGIAVLPYYHLHDGCEIFILMKGSVNYYIEDHCYRLKEGSLMIISPNEYHRASLIDSSVYDRIVINIKTSVFHDFSTGDTNLAHCFLERPVSTRNLIQLSRLDLHEFLVLAKNLEATLDQKDFGYDLLAVSYLLQILVKLNKLYYSASAEKLSALPDIMPVLVKDIMLYIDQNLTDPLSLSELSRRFYHNGAYISRRFKETTGLPLSQYILNKRINLAKGLLEGGHSVTDACMLSGFNNYPNFCRTFSERVGVSPKKYQNSNRAAFKRHISDPV
ncbi:AraC family transcriptional regulator [Lachnoclostridium sp. Marseille-P6806]|uniref:AraC family transcriptional regulator n=1 Tax=Lachnoclostridium sp. Marseille-P6806 TaxID=2364793 RepID=UPI001030FE73|nr:AraC family transcriptional regulator [Lachnoclostridium sp. Marseille-P6806]